MSRILLSLLAIVLIIEEWLWDLLTIAGRFLGQWLHLASFERWLSQVSPSIALVAFIVPLAIVTPINLFAIFLLTHGLLLEGIALEVVAKLLGTLLVARVFALTKTQLLTFGGIAWLYETITGWLHWAHDRVRQTAIYQAAGRFKAAIKLRWLAWRNSQP